MESITQEQEVRNIFCSSHSASRKFERPDLSPSDRRLLLTSTLGLYLRRLKHGYSVSRDDLLRTADYADDAALVGTP